MSEVMARTTFNHSANYAVKNHVVTLISEVDSQSKRARAEKVGSADLNLNVQDVVNELQDVIWANGMEGGHVHGRDGVRCYWTRQWAIIDPHVEPVDFSNGPEGEVVVEVHQVVRDLNGNLLADKLVGHVFRIENGLVKRFDIRAT